MNQQTPTVLVLGAEVHPQRFALREPRRGWLHALLVAGTGLLAFAPIAIPGTAIGWPGSPAAHARADPAAIAATLIAVWMLACGLWMLFARRSS